MTIREAYARATVAKRLEIDVDNRTAADYLIASGWTRSRMAYLLRRLQSEWDGAAKKLHMEEADYILLVGSLSTLKPAIEATMGWCEHKRIPHGERVARATLLRCVLRYAKLRAMQLSEYLEREGRGAGSTLARKIGAYPSDITNWATHARAVPIERAVAIEQATAGAVTRRDLRPDDWAQIWPELAMLRSRMRERPISPDEESASVSRPRATLGLLRAGNTQNRTSGSFREGSQEGNSRPDRFVDSGR